MGRTEPSVTIQPQAYRKAARAKAAKSTVSKTIPALLSSDRRARRGVDAAELIFDPPAAALPPNTPNRVLLLSQHPGVTQTPAFALAFPS